MNKKEIKRGFKIILIIALIAFGLFMLNTIRKLVIIKSLQKNTKQYISSMNYHIKSVSTQDDEVITLNSYQKENKRLYAIERTRDGKTISKISTYKDGEKKHTFFEDNGDKKVDLDFEIIMDMKIYDYFGEKSNMQLIYACIGSKIESGEYNGKECYLVRNFHGKIHLSEGNTEISQAYIEKSTGLVLKTNLGTLDSEREYEFGTVQDEIFAEPDISEYKFIENR